MIKEFLANNKNKIVIALSTTSIVAGSTLMVIESMKFAKKQSDKLKADIVEARATKDKKVLAKAYGKSILVGAKYISVPALLIVSGTVGLLSTNYKLKKELALTSAAYTTLATKFTDYRGKIKKLIGEEKEQLIFTNGKEVKEQEIRVSDEGEMTVEEKTRVVPTDRTFTRLFGDGYSPYWSKDGRAVLAHLQASEGNINALLRNRAKGNRPGVVSVNEVWKELGFIDCNSMEGQTLGFVYIPGDKKYGNTYIDLGWAATPEREAKIDDLKHSWNREIWIDVMPNAVITDFMKHEKIRSQAQKEYILKNRKGLG